MQDELHRQVPAARPLSGSVARLLEIMATLRDPERGCPWDLEQDFASIAPYTIEEAYEVDDAIRRGDMAGLCDELGDLLLQVVFHARMAEEAAAFAFDDVVAAICEKLVRRHPHVFEAAEPGDAAAQSARWNEIKASERAEKGDPTHPLDAVPLNLPALTRAAKIQRRASRAGFGGRPGGDTLGERLFALVAEADASGVDPEQALREATERFREAALRALGSA